MTHSAPTVTLAGGTELPAIGQGTWYMGDDPDRRGEEIAALRAGIEAGSTVVDTAEMYGGGRSESLVGEAIAPVRDQVFLVDKVLPMNASRRGTVEACERSLRALGTEHIDLYLLHWPGSHPLAETLDAFEELMDRDLIGAWGVSNFDPDDLGGLSSPPVTNQVLYNPSRRGVEVDLLPMHEREGILTMAYSPIEQGRLLEDLNLRAVAEEHGASVAQVLIAWAIRSGNVLAIPKAASTEHAEQNAAAGSLRLTESQLDAIDRAFPRPAHPVPLEIL